MSLDSFSNFSIQIDQTFFADPIRVRYGDGSYLEGVTEIPPCGRCSIMRVEGCRHSGFTCAAFNQFITTGKFDNEDIGAIPMRTRYRNIVR